MSENVMEVVGQTNRKTEMFTKLPVNAVEIRTKEEKAAL
jgi:hypothetical protein